MRKNIIIGVLGALVVFGMWVVRSVHAETRYGSSTVYVQVVQVDAGDYTVQIQGREVVGFACTVGEDKLTSCWVASK
jgi:hypothetical protein